MGALSIGRGPPMRVHNRESTPEGPYVEGAGTLGTPISRGTGVLCAPTCEVRTSEIYRRSYLRNFSVLNSKFNREAVGYRRGKGSRVEKRDKQSYKRREGETGKLKGRDDAGGGRDIERD